MKFNPGQNKIVVRQGLGSTTYIKDTTQVQRIPETSKVEEAPVVGESLVDPQITDAVTSLEPEPKTTTTKKKTNGGL